MAVQLTYRETAAIVTLDRPQRAPKGARGVHCLCLSPRRFAVSRRTSLRLQN